MPSAQYCRSNSDASALPVGGVLAALVHPPQAGRFPELPGNMTGVIPNGHSPCRPLHPRCAIARQGYALRAAFGALDWLLALVQARQGGMPHSAQMRSASKTTRNAAGNPSRGRPGARRTSAPATNDY